MTHTFFSPLRGSIGLLYSLIFIASLTSCQKEDSSFPGMNDPQAVLDGATFQTLDGESVQLSDFEGQFVVVDFWETWCSPCMEVFPAMQELEDEYGDNFTMLAVNLGKVDDQETVQEFKENNPYTFSYLIDKDQAFDRFQVPGIPFKVMVGPDGQVLKAEMGSSGRQMDYNKVKTLYDEAMK
ncbi:MAG: TlpA disulfide reductase family protein [Balneolaceae bacterium]|nr:TlpA disulfide reductase family protein [Balneolaceae bacterium]